MYYLCIIEYKCNKRCLLIFNYMIISKTIITDKKTISLEHNVFQNIVFATYSQHYPSYQAWKNITATNKVTDDDKIQKLYIYILV